MKPIIMTIDDELHVLNAIERDLRNHYHDDYRIVKVESGTEALKAVEQLKRRNEPIALFLVDQRMPGLTGIEFIERAIELYPNAKKVLLTAYADTDVAINGINTVGLNHYLLKPWDPPESHLYPILDDLLSDWQASTTLPYDGIRVAGTKWSVATHNVKDFLTRNQIPYQWLDIEENSQAQAMVESLEEKEKQLPVVFFADGTYLMNPTSKMLGEKAGLTSKAKRPFYELIIIGGGPAGLAAAVYGASEGIKTIMIEKDAPGGQAGTSARIENYLGFPQGVSGMELARRATLQAKRMGAEILTPREVISIRVEDLYRIVTLSDGTELSCFTIVIATGMSVKQLDIPGIRGFIGSSIYYGAAVTEAEICRGKHAVVVGGANSAGQGAVYLSRFAKQVTMLVRGNTIERSMSQYLVNQIKGIANIKVMLQTELAEVHGELKLDTVTVRNNETEERIQFPADVIFLFVGTSPRTELVENIVEVSKEGFIVTGPDLKHDGKWPKNWRPKRDPYLMESSVPGIFAVGDVRHNAVRRVASSVGQGSIVVFSVQRYLETV